MGSRWAARPVGISLYALLQVLAPPPAAAPAAAPRAACTALALPVERVGPPPTAYADFCRRNPPECRMPGATALPAHGDAGARLRRVNREVNAEIQFMLDSDSVGEEEAWRYPVGGHGDCEDIALEKRRRLVAQGLPRAALTMAIVHHKAALFSHAVLLAETSGGTLLLDSLSDDLVCWSHAPYNFETRERPDGHWERYDQRVWDYDSATGGPAPAHCRAAPR